MPDAIPRSASDRVIGYHEERRAVLGRQAGSRENSIRGVSANARFVVSLARRTRDVRRRRLLRRADPTDRTINV